MNSSKICIGTSNFSRKYGINNNKINFLEIKKILNFALKKNIYDLDTAISYNNLPILKKTNINLNKFRINIKISLSNIYKYKIKNQKKYFQNLLRNIGLKKFHTISFHNFKDIKKKKGKLLYNQIQILKKIGVTEKIGISLYNVNEIDYLKKNKINFDVIQFPLNFFDRRFLNKNTQHYIKKNKIETHVRSIFLKGLLIQNPKKINKYFNKWNKYLNKWDKVNTTNKKKLTTCISFILNQQSINKIIIGIESLSQLIDIVKIRKSKIPKKFANVNKNFYQPNLWKI